MSFPPIHPFFPKIKYFCLAWCGVWGEGEGLSGCGGAVVITHVETDETRHGQTDTERRHAPMQRNTYLFRHGCLLICLWVEPVRIWVGVERRESAGPGVLWVSFVAAEGAVMMMMMLVVA